MTLATPIPLLGFGTYPLRETEVERCVAMALEVGFRHIDTAQIYGNEAHVGLALKASGLKRGDYYLVTKVATGSTDAARFQPSVEASVEALGGPVDLLLIHWPPPDQDIEPVIDRLVEAHARGLAHAIGVSNFPIALLRRAVTHAPVKLVCNQVEFHPLIDQRRMLAEAKRLDLTLAAFCPLGRGAVLEEEVLKQVAARLGRPTSQVALRWIIQQGVAAIPMTTKRANAESNFGALGFQLSEADMAAISALMAKHRRLVAPSSMQGRWDSPGPAA